MSGVRSQAIPPKVFSRHQNIRPLSVSHSLWCCVIVRIILSPVRIMVQRPHPMYPLSRSAGEGDGDVNFVYIKNLAFSSLNNQIIFELPFSRHPGEGCRALRGGVRELNLEIVARDSGIGKPVDRYPVKKTFDQSFHFILHFSLCPFPLISKQHP